MHPYPEVFIVQEGQATYTVGSATIEVQAGQIAVAPPGVPHKFVNSGTGPLKQVDIHLGNQIITEWLAGRARGATSFVPLTLAGRAAILGAKKRRDRSE
jgi:mannose-6-phosphate isomerase-like protein (cupin superfamily)